MRRAVLVTRDSLRADRCGFMGDDYGTTPALDAMTGDGVFFEHRSRISTGDLKRGQQLCEREINRGTQNWECAS